MNGNQASQSNELAPTLEPLAPGADGDELRKAMDRVRQMGFRFVQLSATQPGLRPRDLDQSGRRDLLMTLRRRELAIAGLDAWIPPQHFLDPVHSDRAVTALQQIIGLAGDLGRVPVSFATASDNRDQARDQMNAIVDSLSAQADRVGVRLADHAIPAGAFDNAVIGVGIDPAAWLSQGQDPVAAVHKGNVGAARLCDLLTSGLRGPAGDAHEGRLDVLAYKIALQVSGYHQPVIVDARQWPDGWRGLEQSTKAWLAR